MSAPRIASSFLVLLLGSVMAHGQAFPPVAMQAKEFVEKKPGIQRMIGLAEILRSQGFNEASLAALQKAALTIPANDPQASELQALVCWRMVPVAASQRAIFRQEVARLKTVSPTNPWIAVWEQYLCAGEANRAALLQAIDTPLVAVPDIFPGALAEKAHKDLLEELGWSRVQAGLEVMAARTQEPLHALRDLDRALTREADFLQSSDRETNAIRILKMRDHYRHVYARACRHVQEKLFVLQMLGQEQERNTLAARAQALSHLHERARLAKFIERIDNRQAWKHLIEPLLRSELAVMDNPPDTTQFKLRVAVTPDIKSRKKAVQGTSTHYEGAIGLRIHDLDVSCEQLTLLHGDEPALAILTGSGMVHLRGFKNYPGGVWADRFIYQTETGTFSLGGDVRLKGPAKTVKLRSCTLTPHGELRDAKSWLDDFHGAFDIAGKLALLPKISAVYAEEELPDEVRFLLALETLRPHLTWRAPYLPLPDRSEHKPVEHIPKRDDDSPWQAALGGEAWMLGEIPQKAKDAFTTAIKDWYRQYADDPRNKEVKPPDLPLAAPSEYFWRIREPQHADIARVLRLLKGIQGKDYVARARRWMEEIERNNTVLTFDIAGGAAVGKEHAMLMDVRNADKVSFKLYRVQRPDELLFAVNRIGKDFLYRDHGLDDKAFWDRERILKRIEHAVELYARDGKEIESAQIPVWKNERLVHQWEVQTADLKATQGTRGHRHWRWDWADEGHDDADGWYFDDGCSAYRQRLEKQYRHSYPALSSWQCDRIVRISGKALAEAGAYVLRAESNGQIAYVPVVVEPLSLTLRRCRDGVFAVVSDSDGTKPIAAATVHARGLIGDAITDKEGVAFARVHARGDRPILVHHQTRYAIGGFGLLFEGIYDTADDDDRLWQRRGDRGMSKLREHELIRAGSVYADRHVVVAYTDRPTYRPGQEVSFKLIVRKQTPDKALDELPNTFRAEEFDRTMKLVLPNLNEEIRYDVLDPKGNAVANGTLKLNDFGTAAARLALHHEAALGNYSMRVRIAGQPRLVPGVFAVKHYRRPNFEIDVVGVPEKAKKLTSLNLKMASRYYFGPPVVRGTVEVQVQRIGVSKPVASVNDMLDDKGQIALKVPLPDVLAGGKYFVICSVTDESGRTVSKFTPLEIESPAPTQGTCELASLPRFVPVGQELKIASLATEIYQEYAVAPTTRLITKNAVRHGVATIAFSKPGWYTLRTSVDETQIFAYGGDQHPLLHGSRRNNKGEAEPLVHPARWVNLSDFTEEENGHPSRWEKPAHHLFALFDRQHVNAGDKLRLLVYVPYQRAKLLFTLEGRTILDYVILWSSEKSGAYQVVEIPIKERYFPNVYLQGRIQAIAGEQIPMKLVEEAKKQREMLLEDEDNGRDPRWCRIDVAKPNVKLDRESLQVAIETNQKDYRPGDSVHACIKVTDRAGRPQAAEVSLAAVDDSVFAFGEDGLERLPSFFHSPHEVRRFQPKVWRASIGRQWTSKARSLKQAGMAKQAEALQNLSEMARALDMSRSKAALDDRDSHFTAMPLPRLGGEMPIGEIPLARLREHFHETATWVPQLRTDAAGTAKVSFTLPDTLTRYRLTAVALTKATDVGVGRAPIKAGLPLSVQVMLPRFAVEKDQLQAVALIHNKSDQPRDCRIEWQVLGAIAELPVPTPSEWKLVGADGKFTGTGRVLVPAWGSAKTGLWLKLDQFGSAKIRFQAADGKEADAEARVLPVEPLGQPREFAANDTLVSLPLRPTDKQGRIQLPPGFLARELHVHVASSEIAQALDGLEYLVDYPYGCIEQTTSRFLPVVMIQHATQHAPIALPPEIAAKVPDILQKGLTRIYSFQHADGSWGWFAKDSQNPQWSVYVVYGLARCQTTGIRVDPQVLQRGCHYLQEELRANRLEPEVAARAWYALALAGHADSTKLEAHVRLTLAQPCRPAASCNLALACRVLGRAELGERLWARASDWHPSTTEGLALKLNTQLAYGATYQACGNSARELLARREGTRWNHTRDTSWAIEALANMLGYIPEKGAVRRLEVTLAGKTILDIRDVAELKKPIHHVHLSGDQLPRQEALELRVKADSDRMIFVSVRSTGVQRRDEVKSSGTRVKLQRYLETLDGEPLRGPLKVGQAIRVRLRLELQERQDYLLVEDRRPACCEFADERLDGSSARWSVHQDWRDDRMSTFFTSLAAGTHEIIYYLRAETPGRYTMLTGCAYPMYDEKNRGETGASKIVVTSP